MLASACGLNRCVEREQSVWRAISCTMEIFSAIVRMAPTALLTALTRSFGIARGLTSNLLGLCSVIGILFDVGGHLLHRGGSLFGSGRLFGRTLAQLLGAGGKFLTAGRDVIGGTDCIADNCAKSLDHIFQSNTQRVLIRLAASAYGQVTFGNRPCKHGAVCCR